MTHPVSIQAAPLRDRRRARAGFTLLEMMVALTAGAIAIGSMYSISSVSTQYFREQQRISNAQSSLRFAMDQIRRDISRAGYGATPSITAYPACQPNVGLQAGPLGRFQAVRIAEATQVALVDPAGGHQIDGVNVHADTLQLMGNYSTASEYVVSAIVGGTRIDVDPSWMTFTRDFTGFVANDYSVDVGAFQNAFPAGRMVRVRASNGSRFFTTVTGTVVPGAAPPIINVGNPITAGCAGFGRGSATVNPVSLLDYTVEAAVGPTAPANVVVSGANAQLVRREISVAGGQLPGTAVRVVAERVVHFNVDLLTNANAIRTQTAVMAPQLGLNATNFANANPERIISAIVTLAVRTPISDQRFGWLAQGPGAELVRFRLDPGQGGAGSFRVRVARAEIFLPNLALEWLN